MRISYTTFLWAKASNAAEERLAVLSQIPKHSRLFSLMVVGCEKSWPWIGRHTHLQTMALVRRESMVNGLFEGEGFNQVEVLFRKPSSFGLNLSSSQITSFNPNMHALVKAESCENTHYIPSVEWALAEFPRSSFDFLWLMSDHPLPAFDKTGLRLIASVGNDHLYRIEPPH